MAGSRSAAPRAAAALALLLCAARPPSARGFTARPVSRYVVESSLAATTGTQRLVSPERSLAAFMSRPADELAMGIKERVSPELLDVRVACEENAEPGLMLTSKRVYFGPRAFGLWVQPRLLLWVRSRKKEKLICDAAYVAGEVAQGLSLTHLSVKTTLTWIESALDHLQGNSIPCLVVSSKLCLEFDRQLSARRPLLALIPAPLLERVCRHAVGSVLADMHGAIATALVQSYEEWCVAPRVKETTAA